VDALTFVREPVSHPPVGIANTFRCRWFPVVNCVFSGRNSRVYVRTIDYNL
jgi:hypothetical protein